MDGVISDPVYQTCGGPQGHREKRRNPMISVCQTSLMCIQRKRLHFLECIANMWDFLTKFYSREGGQKWYILFSDWLIEYYTNVRLTSCRVLNVRYCRWCPTGVPGFLNLCVEQNPLVCTFHFHVIKQQNVCACVCGGLFLTAHNRSDQLERRASTSI